MDRKKLSFEVKVAIAGVIVFLSVVFLAVQVSQEIHDKGLKNILTEVWEGKESEDK